MIRESADGPSPGRAVLPALLVTIILLSLVSFRGAAASVGFRAADRAVVAADEVVLEDLYIAGETVLIEGSVLGDVVAAGRHVAVRGSIEGDLIAVGATVEILGRVRDDVRIAGRTLRLGPEARVGDHLAAAGMSLESLAGSRVQGTQVFGGYQARLAGRTAGDLIAAVNRLELAGSVAGNARLKVNPAGAPSLPAFWMGTSVPIPEVPPGLHLAAGAEIGGDLSYTSPSRAALDPEALVMGATDWSQAPVVAGGPGGPASRLLQALRDYFALLIAGLLLLWRAPDWLEARAESVRGMLLPCLGRGALAVLALIAALLAIALAGGALLVLLGLLELDLLAFAALLLCLAGMVTLGALSFVVLALLSPSIAAYAGGGWAARRLGAVALTGRLAALAGGLLALVALAALPFVGGLIRLLAVLLGLGAMALWSLEGWRARRRLSIQA